jgi:hypothetical protein
VRKEGDCGNQQREQWWKHQLRTWGRDSDVT